MINRWLVTGDTHGDMSRFSVFGFPEDLTEVGIIILGDAGCNYYKNKKDHRTKMALEAIGATFYLVRGNHEDRPENIEGMTVIYDEDVSGDVFVEMAYPHIRYFQDGGIYTIDGHKTLVIGGAYSVDKYWRLTMGYQWFAQEQLTTDEMAKISANVEGQDFDIILSHTCPISWVPTDLFISGIDQSKVDRSMENWLQELIEKVSWKVYLFGHYHADRLERPGVEILFQDIEDLDTVWERWTSDQPLPWWLHKSPNYYQGV